MKAVYRSVFHDYLILTFGTVIVALGIYLFKFPNNFSTGGVAGISIVVSAVLPVSKATVTAVLNMVFLIIGFLFLGKGFGMRTAYSSVMLSGTVYILERLVPMKGPFTDQPMLELVFAILLPAIGSAILFNHRASTGGTDILAMILKRCTGAGIGDALFLSDIAITIMIFIFIDIRTGLYSVLGLLAKSLVVNNVIESFNTVKYFTIVTDKATDVGIYITESLGRGFTIFSGEGGFTGKEKSVILTVVRRPQAVCLRDFVKETDPHAFMMITNTSQIVGKGFNLDI